MAAEEISKSKPVDANRLIFFDTVRNIAMISVILYHAAAAYSSITPWWTVHDGASVLADLLREVLDVYLMPVFFFIAGYFALSSYHKKALGIFIIDKLKRLGVPWLLVMMTIIPLLVYLAQLKNNTGGGAGGFWHYFAAKYLGSLGTIHLGMMPPGQITQMHFWYVSLLIAFFMIFGLICRFTSFKSAATGTISWPSTSASIIRALLVFSVLSTAISFSTMLIFPDMSWITIDLLLQFQPTKVCVYALIFGLGVYAYNNAYNKRWFYNAIFFSRPGIWAAMSVALAVVYLFCGQEVFKHAADSQTLPPATLLSFTAARSFLCTAVLVMLVSFAFKYMNRPNVITQNLAAHSFNIYLVHFFFIIILQNVLMVWRGGPVPIKIVVLLLLTLPASYGISRLVNRFPRGFSVVLIGMFVLAGIALR